MSDQNRFERIVNKDNAKDAAIATAILGASIVLLGLIYRPSTSHSKDPANAAGASKPDRISCQATNPASWLPIPSGLDTKTIDSIAKYLSVSDEQIMNGSIGSAHCEPGLTDEQAKQDDYRASVQGIGSTCLVITASPRHGLPTPNSVYHELGLICASSAAGLST